MIKRLDVTELDLSSISLNYRNMKVVSESVEGTLDKAFNWSQIQIPGSRFLPAGFLI